VLGVGVDDRLEQRASALDVPDLCVRADLDVAQVREIALGVHIALPGHRVTCRGRAVSSLLSKAQSILIPRSAICDLRVLSFDDQGAWGDGKLLE